MHQKMGFLRTFALWFCLGILFAGALVTPGQAMAQGTVPAPASPPASGAKEPPVGGAFFRNLDQVGAQIKAKSGGSLNNVMFNIGVAISKDVVTYAWSLGGGLLLLMLVVSSFDMLTGRTTLLQAAVDIGLPMALAVYLLSNYERHIGSFAGADGVLAFMRKVGGDPSVSVFDLYGALLGMVGRAIEQAWSGVGQAFDADPWSAVLALGDLLVTVLFVLLIVWLCFVGLAEIFGLLLAPGFLCAVGVALGPFFIVGVLTPWTRDYFTRWVGFVVASAVLSGLVGVCLAIATGIFVAFDFTSVTSSAFPTSTGLAIAAVTIMGINAMIQQAPSMTSALVPGSTGILRGAGNSVRDSASLGLDVIKDLGGSVSELVQQVHQHLKPDDGEDGAASESPGGASKPEAAGLTYPELAL